MGERYAIIMAGGGGTRLWPASVAQRPKQLMDPTLGEQSLLAQTIARLDGVVPPERIYIITATEQAAGIREHAPSVPAGQIISEPTGRNTGPCVALGLCHIRARHGGLDAASVIALPADHSVGDPVAFRARVQAAFCHAETADTIVTLGITPSYPATGFGYIERKPQPVNAVEGDLGAPVFEAERFVEKPDEAKAREFLASGRFLWNAGIFVMPLARIATEFGRLCPKTWAALEPVAAALADGTGEDVTTATITAYAAIDPEPIDTAIMEKTARLRVVPTDAGWRDLGSWQAIYDLLAKDDDRNALCTAAAAAATAIDSRGCLIWTEDANVGVIGLDGVSVIASGGRILVCPIDRTQEVRANAEALGRGQS